MRGMGEGPGPESARFLKSPLGSELHSLFQNRDPIGDLTTDQ